MSLLVIHCISLPVGHFGTGHVRALFQNRIDPAAHPDFASLDGLRVSAHLFIDRNGTLIQFVGLQERAWHAGVSQFEGRDRCNDFSVGIELEGTDRLPYTEAQYGSLHRVTCCLMQVFPVIDRTRIVAHSDIAPGRKTDPGPGFDWQRYRAVLPR